jgi:Na+-driven multidrug efflux pump
MSRQIVYLLPATLLLPLVLGVEGALWAGPLADVLAFITTCRGVKSGANSDKPTAHKMSWAIF